MSDYVECRCGKVRYPSRAIARKTARRLYPEDHLSAYRCGGSWHVGHLAPAVVSSARGRREVYGR